MAEPPIAGPWTQAGERPLRSSRVRRARGVRGYVGERPRVVQELWQTLDDEQGEIFAKEDDIVGTAEESRSYLTADHGERPSCDISRSSPSQGGLGSARGQLRGPVAVCESKNAKKEGALRVRIAVLCVPGSNG